MYDVGLFSQQEGPHHVCSFALSPASGSSEAFAVQFETLFVADCGYGKNNELGTALRERGLPYGLARRSSATGGWALMDLAFTFEEEAQNVAKELGIRSSGTS